jgi:hypothetical protein
MKLSTVYYEFFDYFTSTTVLGEGISCVGLSRIENMSHELDLKALWKDLDDYSAEIDREARTLQDVWLKIAQIKAKNDQELKE